MHKVVSTRQAPKAIGPYSQAVRGGPFIFVSGQIPLDLDSQQIIGDDVRQTERALQNIAGILAAGSRMSKVVGCGVFYLIDKLWIARYVNRAAQTLLPLSVVWC
jgi:2-iminobutanoate/2-iminopropanoate deaminase